MADQSTVYTASGGTAGANGVAPTSGGNIFLDILDRAANWDLTRRFGLPVSLDGGSTGAAQPAIANAERTPPAAIAAPTGFAISDSTVKGTLIGGAVLAGVIGLVLILK